MPPRRRPTRLPSSRSSRRSTGWTRNSRDSPISAAASPTEADWRLFTTLVRFDAVYHGHFKCNFRRLVDYAALWDYARRLYQWSGVRQTVDFDHIKGHYYGSHCNINPTGIVPLGPVMDWEEQTVAPMGD